MAEGPVLVVSSEEVSGRQIVKTLGLVRGHSVRARSSGRGTFKPASALSLAEGWESTRRL